MSDYDPKSIHRVCGLLNGAATLVMTVSVFAALGSVFVGFSVGTVIGTDATVAGIGGLVYAAVILAAGYIASLLLRAVAQLMLVLIKIEANTAATLDEDELETVERQFVEMGARAPGGAYLIESLTGEIRALSSSISADGESAPASDIFALGCLWARLFDQTGEPEHRAKALAAMARASDLDPNSAKLGFFDEAGFGSLMSDPDFSRFALPS